jgi:hypothetical protein
VTDYYAKRREHFEVLLGLAIGDSVVAEYGAHRERVACEPTSLVAFRLAIPCQEEIAPSLSPATYNAPRDLRQAGGHAALFAAMESLAGAGTVSHLRA